MLQTLIVRLGFNQLALQLLKLFVMTCLASEWLRKVPLDWLVWCSLL